MLSNQRERTHLQIQKRLRGGAHDRLCTLSYLLREVHESGDCRNCGDQLAEVSEILERQICRLTYRRSAAGPLAGRLGAPG